MLSFREFLTEAIDSKQIRIDVLRYIIDNINLDNKASIESDLERGILKLLEKYVLDKKIKLDASVEIGKRTGGDVAVSANLISQSVKKIKINVFVNKIYVEMGKFDKRFIQILTHEMVHVIQEINSNYKSTLSKFKSGEDLIKNRTEYEYYADKDEIEAFAVNVVQEFQHSGIDLEEAKKMMGKSNFIKIAKDKKISESLYTYYNYFGSKSDRNSQKIWKQFLKKVAQHIDRNI